MGRSVSNLIFNPNWMLRGMFALKLTVPNPPLARFVSATPNCGVFVKMKNCARTLRLHPLPETKVFQDRQV
jgi:hypothetical protein